MPALQPAWLDPRRTALLLIDMQVDNAAPDGLLGRQGLDMTAPLAAVAQAEKLADAARRAGMPLIFLGLQTRPDTDSPVWTERLRRLGGDADILSGLCREGTDGAAFIGPKPQPGETVIGKRRYSGFHGTQLDAVLKARGIDSLVLCGLTTECCVDCTARDAFHRDYHVFIAADACAAYEPELHAAALKALELNCAILADVRKIIGAWRPDQTEVG